MADNVTRRQIINNNIVSADSLHRQKALSTFVCDWNYCPRRELWTKFVVCTDKNYNTEWKSLVPKGLSLGSSQMASHLVLIPHLCIDWVLIPTVSFKIWKVLTILIENWHCRRWGSLPLTTPIALVLRRRRRHRLNHRWAFMVIFHRADISSSSALSSSSVPFRHPSCLVVPSVEIYVGIQY